MEIRAASVGDRTSDGQLETCCCAVIYNPTAGKLASNWGYVIGPCLRETVLLDAIASGGTRGI